MNLYSVFNQCNWLGLIYNKLYLFISPGYIQSTAIRFMYMHSTLHYSTQA